MTASYLFYDIETTGLNKAFDQVLQFAAIRTDLQLNEIERHDIKVKLRPDVIPSPQAILTNRKSPDDFSAGRCEYDSVSEIHGLLNLSGTISLGYNTLGFDDEFLRFSFHRNLLSPYTHQYKNGCRRMDVYPMAVIYYLYKTDIVSWPEIDGKPSLKLEDIGAANQLVTGQSHEAMVDVETTIELARRLFKEKKTWRYLDGYFDKETDAYRISELPVIFQSAAGNHQKGILVSGEYGFQQNFQIPVISIGTSLPYPNQTLWLRLDLALLQETTLANIPETTWVIRKRFGEPGIILPPHDRYWKLFGEERDTLFEDNVRWLQANPDVFQAIITYYREYRYPFIPNLDADASLYQIGFFSRGDEKLCRRFHRSSMEDKVKLVDQFKSPDARELASRVLFRNYPEAVSGNIIEASKKYRQRIDPQKESDALVDYRGDNRATPVGVLAEINRLRHTGDLDNMQLQLLNDLQNYIQTNFSK